MPQPPCYLVKNPGPHHRLLRRQHCSSLCSQSEGHEHVSNMVSALGHYFVGFLARAWPPQYSSPSLCEQSELQCFAPGLRQMSARCSLQLCRTPYVIWLKTAQRFLWILNTHPSAPVPAMSLLSRLLAAGGSTARGRRQHDSRPKVALLAAASSQHLILPSEAAPPSLFFFTTFYPSQPNLASFSLGFVKSRRLRCLFFFVSVFVAAPSPSLYRLEILKKPLPHL